MVVHFEMRSGTGKYLGGVSREIAFLPQAGDKVVSNGVDYNVSGVRHNLEDRFTFYAVTVSLTEVPK
jgi:hypothetical protein